MCIRDRLKTIYNATSGTLTLNDYTVALAGTSSDLAAALAGSFSSSYTGSVTIVGADYTVAQLKAINNATTGVIVLVDPSLNLTGTAADLVSAFAGTITTHTGDITITDTPTDAQLAAIDAATTGTITYGGGGGDEEITGTSAQVIEALQSKSDYTGNITITDTPTLAQLKTINNATSGTITLQDYSVALTGSAADIKAALAGTFASTYTGNITITDANATSIAATDISNINASTTGTITVSNNVDINGTAAAVATAIGNVDTFSGSPTVTLSNAHTLAELKAINNAISGTITLDNYSVALTGSAADVAAALDGSFAANYTGTVSLSDTHTLAQLKTIKNATQSLIHI